MFAELSEKLSAAMTRLRGRGVLTEEALREGLEELRRALLEADVGYDVARAFAAADPYVQRGLVTGWRVRPWNTVVGPTAEVPLP